MIKETKVLRTIDEIKIYSDPYRLRILNAFNRMGRPATVKEVADSLGEVPGKVYYHVKKLEHLGVVWVEETRSINGIIAKYYNGFKGEIVIHHKEIEPAVREVCLSETKKLIGELFNDMRNRYLNRLSVEKKLAGKITSRSLFMNEANAENFFTQLEQLLDSYQQPVNTPGTVAYDFFGAIIADTDVLDHSVDDQSDLKNADQSRSEA